MATLKLKAAGLNYTHYKQIYLLQGQKKKTTSLEDKSDVSLIENHLKTLAGVLRRLT